MRVVGFPFFLMNKLNKTEIAVSVLDLVAKGVFPSLTKLLKI